MAHLINHKLKAGALQYTIFVSVVIALLVFAFISLSYVQQRLKLKASFYKEVIQNTNEGYSHLAINSGSNGKNTIALPTENIGTTTVSKKTWGLFEIATITSTKNKETFTKSALLASYQKVKPALYLQDQNQPLVVVGTTKIQGSAFLPKAGIKTGSIAGHSYVGRQLVYGVTKQSKKDLPRSSTIEQIQNRLQEVLGKPSNKYIEFQEGLNVTNSFGKPTQIIRNYGLIDLRAAQLTGNIIIQSETKIRVQAYTLLKDVLLIAPVIEIKDEVTSNFQAFASKKIQVGKNAKLHYPTALVLTDNGTNKEPQIEIGTDTKIKGIVGYINSNKTDNYKAQILIDKNVTVTGEVYCQQNIELKGTVKGSVYTKGFVANQFGSVYKNHIYNGQILAAQLPKQYAGLRFENTTQHIAKWLY